MKKLIIALSTIMVATGLQAKTKSANVLDLKHSITDSSIVYPESFEADTQKLLESWFMKNYTATDDRYATTADPNVSDAVIIERMSKMPVVIEMPFNQVVRSYIDRYTKKGRSSVPALLGLGLYYNPIFEQALEEQGLPLELKYLPMIESGLDPNAVSKHGATGLWQFMLATAKGLGMEVNSLVDERRDPYLSSEMAANYLKGLYDSYGDWSLAIAAYNCGPGTVNKALRRAGGDAKDHDFWSIYNYLPAETRGYVPAFIAINYVMNYYPEHNISPVLPTAPLVMDTIHVTERVHFDQISNVLDIPVDELRILNPQYRADVIPGSVDTPRNLILPSQQIHAYLMSEDDIHNYQADKYSVRTVVEPGGGSPSDVADEADVLAAVEDTDIWAEPIDTPTEKKEKRKVGPSETVIHKVEPGETLASIAELYEVTPEHIKEANNLNRNAVRVGQQLRITSSSAEATSKASTASTSTKPAATAPAQKTTTAATKPATTTPAAKTTTAATKTTPAASTKANTNTNTNTKTASTAGKNNNQKAAAAKDNNSKNNKNAKADNTKKAAATKTPSEHQINKGENLTTIAKKYGVTVEELQKANNMKDDKIKAGDQIKIPKKKAAATTKNTNTKNTNTNTKKKK